MTKKLYNQPEVHVALIETMALICASAPGSGSGKVNLAETDDPW